MTQAVQPTASEDLAGAIAGPTVGATRRHGIIINVVLYAVWFFVAVGLASILVIASTDTSPLDVVDALYQGAFSDPAAIGLTLQETTPILIVALGVVIAGRAGTFTLGPEGQFVMGGLAAAWVMFKFGMPAGGALPVSLLLATVAGALWAGVAALLRYWRGVDIIISTLLLNFVAFEVLSFFLNKTYLLQEVTNRDVLPPQSPRLAEGFRLPRIGSLPGFSTTSGLFIAAALVVIVWFALSRTRWGFRIRMLGLNANAARASGVSMAIYGGGALVLSGALAGLAGGVWFTGIGNRLVPGFSGNIGGEGLLVALISRRSALATVPIALFFGALRSGGGFLASTGVPRNIVDIVQGLVVLAALMPPVVLHVWEQRRTARAAREAAAADADPTPLGAAA